MLPLLRGLADGAEHASAESVKNVAAGFALSEADLRETLPSGQTTFANRWGWARTYMKKAGLLTYPRRAILQITPAGKQLLATAPAKIDLVILKRYPEFIAFQNSGKTQEQVQLPDPVTMSVEQTPSELIDGAYLALRKQVQSDLLAAAKAGSPKRFEMLVLELLVAMGYGGSRQDAARQLGHTGDGGIDGEIKEDKLGLDRIYLQAKRWENGTVGSREIRDFVGALTGRRARKGVFITTSTFTKDALEFAARVNEIVLIDGEQMAELMFEHGLGVTTERVFELKRIDSDFFDEEP